ncbi:TetR/AcrR family transcriptional regulator [Streptomyces sulphureus]|uniref:TetR/AcrR family transcriptional regulator n=1 Tax=Streptomyces sulphureus TaxID=47758 RepID=UPI00039D917A|nr:TetR/AcrR family transcriptional regulator [Streptomyces sulphureus]
MSSEETQRRASYGPNSPQIGAKGARTRQRIIDETLTLFEEKGFHGTLVDGIAERSGVSRATLYQYFESKDEIFRELMEECGAALHRVVRRLGPLGPTEQGFDNLHWWLGEWAWVFDKYATMFAQWSRVATVSAEVRPRVDVFVEGYVERIEKRLASSGVSDINTAQVGTLLTVLVHRFNFYRYLGAASELSDEQALDGLAVVAQLMLFPETPDEVFADMDLDVGPEVSVVHWPAGPPPEFPDRFAGLSARARATVGRLLDSACRVFHAYSYHMATIDDVVGEAGVARGTFYKYFTDKTDLLTAIAEEGARVLPELLDRLAEVEPDDEDGLRAWLREYESMQSRYVGLIRFWLEGLPYDGRLREAAVAVGHHAEAVYRAFLDGAERSYPFNVTTASLVLEALLERGPDGLADQATSGGRDDVVELLAKVVERGLVNDRRQVAGSARGGAAR